jgi:hypothetical protein
LTTSPSVARRSDREVADDQLARRSRISEVVEPEMSRAFAEDDLT